MRLKLNMMKLAVPPDISVELLNIADAAASCCSSKWEKDEAILLLESPKDAYELRKKGCQCKTINVGGLHIKDNRQQVTDNLAMNEEDIKYLKLLLKDGVELEGRALPSDEEYRLDKILAKL